MEGFELEKKKFISECMCNRLPIRVSHDKDYLPVLKEIYAQYEKEVSKAGFISEINKRLVKEVCEKIVLAVEYTYSGQQAQAFDCVKELFDKDKLGKSPYVRMMCEFSEGTEHKTLYKGRCAKEINSLSEMFHRPFSQRPYMSTERYSIPGLPCLYLAGSVYTCWQEIGRPDFKDFYVSRYEANDAVTVLDLARLPSYDSCGEYDEDETFVIWPLICAISFCVSEENRVFKSEYMISQLLMQIVIQTKGLFGIRYFSVHMPQKQIGKISPVYVNYAFPAPYENDKGNEYSSSLCEAFKLTSPLCMIEFSVLSEANRNTLRSHSINGNYMLEGRYQNTDRRNAMLLVGMDKFVDYAHTDFFEMEDMLYRFKARRINE